jgi:DNA-binding FadR family transcriptional regulator
MIDPKLGVRMDRVKLTAAPQATADVLREVILDRERGALLGSEDDLLEQLGVSRPTLRQAARILEQEGLLRVRRGIGGGFFTNRPDASAIAHATAIYLRSEQATVEDVFEARLLIEVECAALAATAPKAQRKKAMEKDLDGHQFHLEVAQLTGNTVTVMFVDVLINVAGILRGRPFSADDHNTPEAALAHQRIKEAIIAGDADLAAERMRKHLVAARKVIASVAATRTS